MSGSVDKVFRNVRVADREGAVDIAVAGGRIAAIGAGLGVDAEAVDLGGKFAVPGFVDSHVHLDKSRILDRCPCCKGTLDEALELTAAAKLGFTEEDIYARGRKTLEAAILQGTTRMRTHVEIDTRIGLRGFHAVSRLKQDYAWAIDLELCVFPQEGLLNDPGTEALLREACAAGADLIGGCPYTDSDPRAHMMRIFEMARAFDLDIDFHLDFDLDPSWMHLDEVCRLAEAFGWGGRVAIGHVTKLSALSHAALDGVAGKLAAAGVAVTVLPATDLFLMGRESEANVPRGVAQAHRLAARGVTASIATNNVLNPFTPYGDASLARMANLYANVAQLARPGDLALCLDMVTGQAARLMNLADYGFTVGNAADLVLLDCADAVSAVSEIAPALGGWKRGRRVFTRSAVLHRP